MFFLIEGIVLTADYLKILELLPHRHPFLMVDKVHDIILGESAIGIKNVTLNDPVFSGHFPANPIFPGVLIIEAMAQTSAVLALLTINQEANLKTPSETPSDNIQKSVYFMTIDEAKFRKPVRPADVMEIKVVKEQSRGNVWKLRGEVCVNGEVTTEANLMAMINK